VQASPPVCTFKVDDTTYSAAHSFVWSIGSVHLLSTTTPQLPQSGMKNSWIHWSDGDSISHHITTPAVNTTYTAVFDTSYYLTMSAGNGGSVGPSSGWYKSGESVPIVAHANAGWKLNQWVGLGKGSYSGTDTSAAVTMDSVITETAAFELATGLSDRRLRIPSTYELSGSYPNPFNPSTTIRYGLPRRSHVLLTVYSTLSQKVAELANGDMDAGYHEVRFDGRNLASGIYFYRLQAGEFIQTRKLLLVK
ncbi:MAG TPA: T9SS type A sorting domain-containing protein, partial [Bacteroidota bacterium]|nr:T9SS type A sorting domain-containing protein [Bacteroidota bacterium]